MGEKFSIYAGEPMALALSLFDDNRSGRINAICDRYLAIVAKHTPVMTRGEWSAVCDVINGAFLDARGIDLCWASVADSGPDGIGEKWGVDVDALANRIRAMSLAERVAMCECVERFWSMCVEPDALDRCGARFSPDD